MTQDQSICIGCGLCCDGTLFGRFSLNGGDVEALRGAGVRLADTAPAEPCHGRQPCGAFTGGQCGAYAIRPTVCRDYRCKLLRAVEDGRRSSAEARAIIVEARRLADESKSLLGVEEDGASMEQQAASAGLHRLATPAARRAEAERLLAYGALQVFLNREFDDRKAGADPAEEKPPMG